MKELIRAAVNENHQEFHQPDESKASNKAARQGYLQVMVRIRPLLNRDAEQAAAVIATSSTMLQVCSDFIFDYAYVTMLTIYMLTMPSSFFHQYNRSRQVTKAIAMSSIASSATRQIKKPSMLKYPSLLSQL